jgi:acyl-CoA synthetase (AMP-forming)/AMP-acid ligase II
MTQDQPRREAGLQSGHQPWRALLGNTSQLHDWRSGRRLDRAEVLAQSGAQAAWLGQQGFQRGDPVVIASADPLQVIVDLFACWQAGLVAVLINPAIVAAERSRVTAATGAVLWLQTTPGAGPGDVAPDAASGQALGADEPALILMTSGTTGTPKGVTLSLGALSARVSSNRARIGDATLRRVLSVLPVYFGHGLIGTVLTPLAAGGAVTLWPSPALGELPGLGATLDKTRATFLSSVPSFWRMALRLSPSPKVPPEQVHIGSERLSPELWQQVATWAGTQNVLNMYGLTEAANWVGGATLEQAAGAAGFVGRPWQGAFAILDANGDVQTLGAGEVLIRSAACMSGIWNDTAASDAAFHHSWLRTGDIGSLDDTGLTLSGRIKSQINRGGVKILADEIEQMLERHPDVAEAAAFAIPDPVSGEGVGAAIVAQPGTAPTVEALRDWCRTQVRAEAVPARIAIVPALVRNDRGKLMRDATRDLVLGPS